MNHQGGCHCGRIRFNVNLPDAIEVEDCNCSICSKTGFLHVIVPMSAFELEGDYELETHPELALYQFNEKVAKHYFCRHCGIKPFYIPRSNPDGIDINLRCLDTQPPNVTVVKFDGQNWEQNAAALAHKSIAK